MSTFFNIAFERTVREVFDNNKANLETSLENLLIPLANSYLNELTLQDLLNGIGNESDEPHMDPETGELICQINEEHPTSELPVPSVSAPSASVPSESTLNPTVPNELTTIGNESTTLLVPGDASNSSNFLFHKFQMIFTVATMMSLRILC